MTDNAKSVIIAIGLTITVGVIGIALKPLWPFLHGIVAGPGMLVHAYLGRITDSFCISWPLESIPQFIIIYLLAISACRRPPFWRLWIGLLSFAWLLTGIVGYQIMMNVLSSM